MLNGAQIGQQFREPAALIQYRQDRIRLLRALPGDHTAEIRMLEAEILELQLYRPTFKF